MVGLQTIQNFKPLNTFGQESDEWLNRSPSEIVVQGVDELVSFGDFALHFWAVT